MSKTAYITARVEPGLKESAESVLNEVGLSTTDAITMFLRQIVMHRGLPFDARIPNTDTRAAMAELEAGGGETFRGSTDELFTALSRKSKTKA